MTAVGDIFLWFCELGTFKAWRERDQAHETVGYHPPFESYAEKEGGLRLGL